MQDEKAAALPLRRAGFTRGHSRNRFAGLSRRPDLYLLEFLRAPSARQQIAEHPAEILVMGVAQKTAGVGEHTDEADCAARVVAESREIARGLAP